MVYFKLSFKEFALNIIWNLSVTFYSVYSFTLLANITGQTETR